jgi:hypothetical protein
VKSAAVAARVSGWRSAANSIAVEAGLLGQLDQLRRG